MSLTNQKSRKPRQKKYIKMSCADEESFIGYFIDTLGKGSLCYQRTLQSLFMMLLPYCFFLLPFCCSPLQSLMSIPMSNDIYTLSLCSCSLLVCHQSFCEVVIIRSSYLSLVWAQALDFVRLDLGVDNCVEMLCRLCIGLTSCGQCAQYFIYTIVAPSCYAELRYQFY